VPFTLQYIYNALYLIKKHTSKNIGQYNIKYSFESLGQPGFDLPRQSWTLLNRFQTDQGPRRANLHKWGLEFCDCGQRQTMGHIVDLCPLTQLDGGLTSLEKADDDAVTWLKTTAATALPK